MHVVDRIAAALAGVEAERWVEPIQYSVRIVDPRWAYLCGAGMTPRHVLTFYDLGSPSSFAAQFQGLAGQKAARRRKRGRTWQPHEPRDCLGAADVRRSVG